MDDSKQQTPIILISGAMAAGKSTVAQRLAERFPKSMHLRGDSFRRFVVSGREDMSAEPTKEAAQQLLLRYQATAAIAKLYSSNGFTVICQDVIIGPILKDVVNLYAGSTVQVFVLCPDADTIQERELNRQKTGYGSISISELQNGLSNTPRIGCWIDNSNLSVDETVQAILDQVIDAVD